MKEKNQILKGVMLAAFFVSVWTVQAQQAELGLNLKKGETYQHVTHSVVVAEQDLKGQKISTEITLDRTMSFSVKEIDDGVFNMDVQYDKMKMSMSMPNNPMATLPDEPEVYSSEKPESDDAVSEILAAMTGKVFQVSMNKTGEVTEIENLDEVWEQSMNAVSDSEVISPKIKKQMRKAYGEKSLEGNIEKASYIYPDRAVNTGDTWSVTTKMMSSFSTQVDTEFQLKELHSDYCIITGKSQVKSLNEGFTETNGVQIKYDISGKMTSEIKVDRASGWIIEAHTEQDLDGQSEIKSPQLPNSMTIPMTVNSTPTLTD